MKTKTFTYWYARCLDDRQDYAIIARTRREARAMRAAEGADSFGSVVKRAVVYTDLFSLVERMTGEGGGRGAGLGPSSVDADGDG